MSAAGFTSGKWTALLALLLLGTGPAAALGRALPDAVPNADAMPPLADSVLLTGALDGSADKVDFGRVSVAISGTALALSPDGQFTARIARSDYYQITIGGDGVFTMVQTFGGEELRDATCACLKIPPIELVARKNGRIELFFGGDTMAGRRYLDPGKGKRRVLGRATLAQDLAALFRPMQPYFVPSDTRAAKRPVCCRSRSTMLPWSNGRISPRAPCRRVNAGGGPIGGGDRTAQR